MTRTSIFLLSVGVLFLSLAQSSPAVAACDLRSAVLGDEGSGAGGTGVIGSGDEGDGSGAGGTGVYAQSGEGGSGAGGTGHSAGDDDMSGTGTGGTGIMGIITGFGSVCVNGFEIDYDDKTVIERNGKPAGVSDLAVGQVVRIHTESGNPTRAQHLKVESALAGPVDRIDASRGLLWVMGQPVQLRGRGVVYDHRSGTPSKLAAIEVGSYVDVSGLRRGDGLVVATRIDQRSANSPALITGIANRVSVDTVYVDGLRTTLRSGPSGLSGPEFEGSDRVLIRGRWNAETKTLERTNLDRAPTHRRGARSLSVQGYLTAHRGSDMSIQGIELDLSDVRSLGSLKTDTLVRIEGRIDSRGRLRVRRVVVEERGRSGTLLGESPGMQDDEADTSDRSDREDRSGRSGRSDREEREGRSERSERSERPERTERAERPERAGRVDR